MGLDLVELAIEVEEVFGITILDADAPNIITVGQLYDYVIAKLPAQETERCLSAMAFYQFRSALTDQFGVDRKQVRPSAFLDHIVPEPSRRSDWRLLGRRLDWHLPPLVRPAWMRPALFAILLGGLTASIAAWGWTAGFSLKVLPLALGCTFCGTVVLLAAAIIVTTPFATRFSGDSLTVRSTLQAVLASDYGKLSVQGSGWSREEVWECLRATIAQQLGLPAEKVVKSAEFVRDFGAD